MKTLLIILAVIAGAYFLYWLVKKTVTSIKDKSTGGTKAEQKEYDGRKHKDNKRP